MIRFALGENALGNGETVGGPVVTVGGSTAAVMKAAVMRPAVMRLWSTAVGRVTEATEAVVMLRSAEGDSDRCIASGRGGEDVSEDVVDNKCSEHCDRTGKGGADKDGGGEQGRDYRSRSIFNSLSLKSSASQRRLLVLLASQWGASSLMVGRGLVVQPRVKGAVFALSSPAGTVAANPS